MNEHLFWKEMGCLIKMRRIELNVTQQALAKLLNVTRTAIVKIENGERKVSTLELTKIAQRLFHPVWEFVPETTSNIKCKEASISDKDTARHQNANIIDKSAEMLSSGGISGKEEA